MGATRPSDRFSTADFDQPSYAKHVARCGYAIVEDVCTENTVEYLRDAIENIGADESVRRRRGVYGVRNLLDICDAAHEVAIGEALMNLVRAAIGPECFAVRAVFFDKIADANWSLGWHQDSVIAVRERCEVEGFVGWSQKAGVWQVQPPAEVMAQMLAVRVHLDDCGSDNGPLRVLPSSHCHGWLDHEIDQWKADVPEVVCHARAGDVVIMRPLILHASAKADSPHHRRVIHIEYACQELPAPLQWRDQLR